MSHRKHRSIVDGWKIHFRLSKIVKLVLILIIDIKNISITSCFAISFVK